MISRRELVRTAASIAAAGAVPEAIAQAKGFRPDLTRLEHRVNDPKAPAVFFAPGVSAASVMKAYRALGWKPEGKVAVKTSFEGPNGPYVDPELLRPLMKELKGTFVDTNGFSAPRNRTDTHLKLAADHGFSKVAPVDILDADGSLDLPVPRGYRLKIHRVGSHFANYASFVSVIRYKLHNLPMLGGSLKNLAITLASISGKCNIHSAGKNLSSWEGTDNVTTVESISDAVKAALAARPGRWCFIAVMSSFKPVDRCRGAIDTGDIGILASLDPVALDQACTDITMQSALTDADRKAWAEEHALVILEKAEKNGVGRTRYRLVGL